MDELEQWHDDWSERAQAALDAIEVGLRERLPRIMQVPCPEPLIADEPPALFDSKRSYAEQLFAYKRYGNGTNGEESDDEGIVEAARIDTLRQACLAMGLEKEAENGDDGTDPGEGEADDWWEEDDD